MMGLRADESCGPALALARHSRAGGNPGPASENVNIYVDVDLCLTA